MNFVHQQERIDLLAKVRLCSRIGPSQPEELTSHQWRSVLLCSGFINYAEDYASRTWFFPTPLFVALFDYAYCKPLGELQQERKALLEDTTGKANCKIQAQRIERDIVLEISNRNFSQLRNDDDDVTDSGDCDGKSQQTLLTEILRAWISDERLSAHICDIDVAVQMCIANDNARILATMLQHTLNDAVYDSECSRNRVMLQHINLAARCGSMECLAQLLGEPDELDWTGQLRDPQCLMDAVQLHGHDLRVAHLIIDRLEKLNLRLDCAQIMEVAIERDLVDIARRLMENDWHRVTPQDESLAFGKCRTMFQEKMRAQHVFVDNHSGDILMLCDDDWDGAEEFSDFGDEDAM